MELIDDLLNLLIPSTCAFCKISGSSVCESCITDLGLSVRSVSRPNLSGFSTAVYSDPIAKLIHEFKEAKQTSVAKIMIDAMLPAVQFFDIENCLLVPMPSRKSSFAQRGFSPANLLANSLARRIAKEFKVLMPVYRGLVYRPELVNKIPHQASLNGSQRRTNLIGTMVAQSKPKFLTAILVDDIVTTGATLIEAQRALAQIGVSIQGFLTFGETLPNTSKRYKKNLV